MAGNTEEQIEAKLAEYVEGTLDEAGRAEIERHLQANPSHRSMLAELIQMRQTLRSLPRAAAPADLMDDFQGQLERTALLGGADEEPPVILRINRWPQVMAAAAVIALAMGLGAVVYMMLPPNRHATIVMAPQEERANLMPAAPELAKADEDLDRRGVEAADRLAEPPGIRLKRDEPGSVGSVVSAREGGAVLALNKDGWAELLNGKQAGEAQIAVADSGLRMQGPVVLTVLAYDLAQANNDVVQTLNAQGVSWSAEGQAPVQVAQAESKHRGYVAAKGEQPAPSAQAPALGKDDAQQKVDGAGQQVAGLMPSDAAEHRYLAKGAADVGQGQGGGGAAPAPARAQAQGQLRQQVARADEMPRKQQTEPPRANVYRARVNARQVQEITEALQHSGSEPGRTQANIVTVARLEDQSRKELGRQDRAEQMLADLAAAKSGLARLRLSADADQALDAVVTPPTTRPASAGPGAKLDKEIGVFPAPEEVRDLAAAQPATQPAAQREAAAPAPADDADAIEVVIVVRSVEESAAETMNVFVPAAMDATTRPADATMQQEAK